MKSSLISGLAGSIACTLLHETLRKTVNDAPRMDKMGRQGLKKLMRLTGTSIPAKEDLQKMAMAGDLVGNAGYYALVGVQPEYALLTGSMLGLAAGIGAVALPDKLGLNKKYSNATGKTQALTVLIYLTGGLVAGAVYSFLNKKSIPR